MLGFCIVPHIRHDLGACVTLSYASPVISVRGECRESGCVCLKQLTELQWQVHAKKGDEDECHHQDGGAYHDDLVTKSFNKNAGQS